MRETQRFPIIKGSVNVSVREIGAREETERKGGEIMVLQSRINNSHCVVVVVD